MILDKTVDILATAFLEAPLDCSMHRVEKYLLNIDGDVDLKVLAASIEATGFTLVPTAGLEALKHYAERTANARTLQTLKEGLET